MDRMQYYDEPIGPGELMPRPIIRMRLQSLLRLSRFLTDENRLPPALDIVLRQQGAKSGGRRFLLVLLVLFFFFFFFYLFLFVALPHVHDKLVELIPFSCSTLNIDAESRQPLVRNGHCIVTRTLSQYFTTLALTVPSDSVTVSNVSMSRLRTFFTVSCSIGRTVNLALVGRAPSATFMRTVPVFCRHTTRLCVRLK